MKIGLGTVQFGTPYGISNTTGQTPEQEVHRILTTAASHGIRTIDTASLYGDSEQVLGRQLSVDHVFRIVTKTPRFDRACISAEDGKHLKKVFDQSCSYLRQQTVYGLLVHNADDLLTSSGAYLMDAMSELKSEGRVSKIGASVYSASQIDRILERFSIDLIQLPINVLDQRLIKSGHLAALKHKDVEVHGRSVFLQGMLLMDPDRLPAHFAVVKPLLVDYFRELDKLRIGPVQAALALSQDWTTLMSWSVASMSTVSSRTCANM